MHPSNDELAALFVEAAELLAIQGGDPHRARAFRRAARALEQLAEPAPRLLPLGQLARVRGIGEGTIRRIKEILRRGSFEDLDRLRARLPAGLRDLLRLRGLGPTRVRLIHQQLGVSSVEELEYAARSGLLQARVPGMGQRSAERALLAIEELRRHRERLPLGVALEIGQRMVEGLRGSGAVDGAEIVGSLRRRLESVGDLDFVAGAADRAEAVAAFCALPELVQVESRGGAAATGRLATGHRADIWVVAPEELGAALHAYSGSQTHVVAIRERAARRGLHISEHGVFDRARERRLAPGEREEEIFAAVGLPFIPPELREGAGEIEAAERGRLPRPVRPADLRGDLHLHTRDSDGRASARQMADAARAAGLEYIAVTDHSGALAVAGGLDAGRLSAQAARLRAMEVPGLRVLAGVEVDILPDGSLDLDPETLRDLDWVVASVHSRHEMDAAGMTERLVRAMESGLVDCLGHPTGRRIGARDGYAIDLERVLRAAARTGTAVEINSSTHRLDLDAVSARRAGELGVDVVVSSDAHAPEELARHELGVAVARRVARRAWLEPHQLLNTRPVEAILERRRDRLRHRGIAVPARLVAESEGGAVDRGEAERLRGLLEADRIDGALRERLERYLREGGDAALEAALGESPLQRAFNLVTGTGSPL